MIEQAAALPQRNGGRSRRRLFGPGLIMAVSGIGASDIISATVGGATYGTALLWAVVLGAFFKFVLSEGLARWQLATGTTLLRGGPLTCRDGCWCFSSASW